MAQSLRAKAHEGAMPNGEPMDPAEDEVLSVVRRHAEQPTSLEAIRSESQLPPEVVMRALATLIDHHLVSLWRQASPSNIRFVLRKAQ